MEATRRIQTQLWLPRPLEEIWDFHRDPNNLVKISPDFLKMTLQNVPAELGKGAQFLIHTENKFLRPFFKWNVEYVDWGEEENYKFFVDTQKEGPFQHWKHRHDFKRGTMDLAVGDKVLHPKEPGTWIIDTLEYALKPQVKRFEWAAHKMIHQLFVFRKRRLSKLFRLED